MTDEELAALRRVLTQLEDLCDTADYKPQFWNMIDPLEDAIGSVEEAISVLEKLLAPPVGAGI